MGLEYCKILGYGGRLDSRDSGITLGRVAIVKIAFSLKIGEYKHSVLVGKPCIIENGFIVAMDRLCFYANEFGLKLYINSSYRNSTAVSGAIVTPATLSNHLIGHAIDANIVEGNIFWNSKKLEKGLTGNVLKFIDTIRKDTILRWGGDFPVTDVVHFDDGLNVRDHAKWLELYNELQSKA